MRRFRNRRILAAILVAFTVALGLLGSAPTAPATAQATTVTTNIRIPVDFSVSNVCAGEIVQLSGEAHLQAHVTIDSSGGAHVVSHFNYQNLSGTGLTSGNRYRLSDADQSVFNAIGPPPSEFTVVSHFHLIGQGSDNNLLILFTGHITTNANGEVTSVVLNAREEECR